MVRLVHERRNCLAHLELVHGIMQALDLLAQLVGLRLDLAHALLLVEDAHDTRPG